MQFEETRKTVLKAILEAYNTGLINGTSGNIAMRTPEDPDIIAITPSGIDYEGMMPEDIAIVRMNEDGTNDWIDGRFKPSSEVPMHTAVMRARKDVNATVHTHSKYATICAMGEEPLLALTPPHCEFVPIGVVNFHLPGSREIADEVCDQIGESGRVCLMKNHGLFACGKDMKAAMHAARYTEEMSELTVISKQLGTYEPLPEDAVEKTKELLLTQMAV